MCADDGDKAGGGSWRDVNGRIAFTLAVLGPQASRLPSLPFVTTWRVRKLESLRHQRV